MQLYPDKLFVKHLLEGFKRGFDIGMESIPKDNYMCDNNLSAKKNSNFVAAALKEEVDNDFMVGPLKKLPWASYRVSPLGVAEHKYSGKLRLICDLSAPHSSDIPSINSLIDKDKFSLTYVKVDDAVRLITKLGRFTSLCKFDIANAFKIMPIKPELHPYLCVCWEGMFYYWTKAVFGSRSSPKIFTDLSKALHFIATNNYGVEHLLYLLDDFLCLIPPGCDGQIARSNMELMFRKLNIPLNPKKTEGPCYKLTYLGLELDTDNMECRLPRDKVERIVGLLQHFLTLKSCTKLNLLSILGHLAFAGQVVRHGRTYVGKLIELSTTVSELHDLIHLKDEIKEDIYMWLYLLSNWNGKSAFHISDVVTTSDIKLFTDSSSSYGFGGFLMTSGEYFYDTWINYPLATSDRAMTYLELFPIVVSSILFGDKWGGKHIVFISDNEGTVAVIRKGRSTCKNINKLLRRLVYVATSKNFTFTSRWISTKLNLHADFLSRGLISSFQRLAPHAVRIACPPLHEITLSRHVTTEKTAHQTPAMLPS